MGLMDKFGKVVKDVSKGVIDTGKSIKKGIDENIEMQRKKKSLLNKFTMNDLKKICSEYGIGQPSSYNEDFLTGEKEKITLTREDYIEYIEEKLDLDHVEDYCKKHRMNIPDSPREEKQSMPQITPVEPIHSVVSPQPQEPKTEIKSEPIAEVPIPQPSRAIGFDEILDFIKGFKPEPFADEKDLQNQLKVLLFHKFPNRIIREGHTQSGGKIDFVIDIKYGIEVKPIWDKNTLINLLGQISIYKETYQEIAIILCDINNVPQSDIENFISRYRNQGVKTIVLSGRKRSKRGRPQK